MGSDVDDPSDTEMCMDDRSHTRCSQIWQLWKDMALYNQSHYATPDTLWHSYLEDQMMRLGWIYYVDRWRKVPKGRSPMGYMNELARMRVDYDAMSDDSN